MRSCPQNRMQSPEYDVGSREVRCTQTQHFSYSPAWTPRRAGRVRWPACDFRPASSRDPSEADDVHEVAATKPASRPRQAPAAAMMPTCSMPNCFATYRASNRTEIDLAHRPDGVDEWQTRPVVPLGPDRMRAKAGQTCVHRPITDEQHRVGVNLISGAIQGQRTDRVGRISRNARQRALERELRRSDTLDLRPRHSAIGIALSTGPLQRWRYSAPGDRCRASIRSPINATSSSPRAG